MCDPTFPSILGMPKHLKALFSTLEYDKRVILSILFVKKKIKKSRDGSNWPSCSPLKMAISVGIILDRYLTLPLHIYSSVCLSQCIVTSLFDQIFGSKTQGNYLAVAFRSNHYNHYSFR